MIKVEWARPATWDELTDAYRILLPTWGRYRWADQPNHVDGRRVRKLRWIVPPAPGKVVADLAAAGVPFTLRPPRYLDVRVPRDIDYRSAFEVALDPLILSSLREVTRLRREARAWARLLASPHPSTPDVLGMKVLRWDRVLRGLVSPSYHAIWPPDGVMDAVDCLHGIYARHLPVDWRLADLRLVGLEGYVLPQYLVRALVERHGYAVAATTGWHARRVAIRELCVSDRDIGLQVELAYPDIPIHYTEDSASWTSARR